MKLVIAEKPSVAQSLAAVIGATARKDGYLEGNGWRVSWCVGHLAGLADADSYDPKYAKWRYDDLPILPEHWQMVVGKDKKKQFDILKKLMNAPDVTEVVNACDAGREGELIFRSVYELADCKKPMKRLWISSMEDSAIREGFANLRPGADYDGLRDAALCRAKADWLVGINATRLFSVLYHRTLNIGRVMSPTLALIVQREAEIDTFKPIPFYTVALELPGLTVSGERMADKAAAEQLREACQGANVTIKKVECKEKSEKPPGLYDLTTLQRDANRLLGFTAQQTLDYLQSLYEKKLCTYPRTDSRYLTGDMADSLPVLVNLVANAMPFRKGISISCDSQTVINDKKVTDHHAVIPTRNLKDADLSVLPAGEKAVLELVALRLLCAVAQPHIYSETVVIAACAGGEFTAKGKTVKHPGWKALEDAYRAKMKDAEPKKEGAEKALPELTEGQTLSVSAAIVKEGKSSPPQHFTEDTLLSAMETAGKEDMPEDAERKGLGTPATRAGILEKLVSAGFLERKKSRKTVQLLPSHDAVSLITVLPEQLQSPLLTAEWEYRLGEIERGQLAPEEFLDGISTMLKDLVGTYQVIKGTEYLFTPPREVVGKCPRCGGEVAELQKGFFCQNDSCKFAIWKNNKSSFTAEWQIKGKSSVSYNDVAAYTTYGTSRANAYKILEDSLNLRDVRIYDTIEDADGKERRVLNAKETTLAAQKQQAIREAFRDWIWRDPERRQTLVRQYNEEMNSTRPREYDGSHITFGGMNPAITLREHQKSAIAHVLYGGNTLLAHEVGAGKTFEMVAAAMEAKRLGLCQKSLFVVPNHLTEQWASEFLRLYPSANILVTTKKDFETHNRKKFCARIATGDYDAIIMGHSQFERIPISRERQERLLYEQIDEITEGIAEVQASGGERFTVKQLERTRKSLEARLEKLQAEGRKDDVVTFEQLGVDRLFVDEAHNYKNLFLYTKMRNVAGLSTSDAQKSSDMFAKCRYMDEITGNRGVIFATGTPVSNSMTELYTMQRYLQYERLQELNMTHFDCWASRFGETVTALELAPEGTGYRARTRFSKFFNLPELMNLFKEVADIKTADQLNLPTPEVEYHNVVAQPTEHQQEMVKALSERASLVHSGTVDPSQDNMLKITSDGRKLGLDQRIVNQMLPDEPGTKVNQCVENIMQIWRDGEADKLTQLVFCDISTPQAKAPASKAAKTLDNPLLHALEGAVPLPEQEPAFTVYDDIRQKLIAQGMPADQIAFIHEANTEVRKKELFSKVRTGQVRVLMGSTAKMGAGTNVQDRLVALHDLDCPWRPGDLAQRKGRIERQGNQNPLVHVYRYVTEGTFDAYLWQTVENKQKFISQIMTSKSPVRSCDDVDETALSFAEIKALCAGDPRIKERMDLDVEVSRLKLMKADHQSKQYRLEDQLLKYFPEEIEKHKGFIKGFESDLEVLTAHPHPEDGFAGMEIRGDLLTDKENAGAALLDACKEVKTSDPVQIGNYRGYAMSVEFSAWKQEYTLLLKGQMTHRATLGTDPRGNLTRIDNALAQMPQRLEAAKAQLDNLYQQQAAAKEEVGKPFLYEEELRSKNARLVELDTLLNIDGKGQAHTESVVAKSTRPSVLDNLKRPLQPRSTDKKPKQHEEVR